MTETSMTPQAPAPLLQVRDLSIDFPESGAAPAVNGLGFRLDRGQTLALLGESGSGKSLTALALMRLLPPAARAGDGASLLFAGENLMELPPARMRQLRGNRIAMVFQEPMTALNPLHTVERQLREALAVHGRYPPRAQGPRIAELLRMVGLENLQGRLSAYPHQLSGGQRQRLMIALALANEPDLLIADEPTTALDVTVQAQILDLLQDLKRRFNMALLFITHDLDVARKMADHVCVMEKGEAVESGPADRVFTAPRHPATRRLMQARFTALEAAPPPPADNAAPVLLEARNLRVWYPVHGGVLRRVKGHVRAVDDISLSLRRGSTLGVVGESGSGKSSLGLALLRLCPARGHIGFLGADLQQARGAALRRLRRRMQPVFQDPYGSLSPRMTIGDIVGEGLRLHEPGLRRVEYDRRVAGALTEVRLDPEMRTRYPHEFSGGQRQRVAIARAMILRPDLLVLDEPTSALDLPVQVEILNLLRDLQQRYGTAYILISHDLRVVRALARDLLVMQGGRVVEQGAAAQLFKAPQKPYTRTLMAAALNLNG